MSSDLATLQTIFEARLFPQTFLEAVLVAHGSLPQACDYLSSLTDADVSYLYAPTEPVAPQQQPLNPDDVIANLKEIILPSLTSQITHVVIPDIEGRTERVKYNLSNLSITELTLPSEHVSIDLADDQILITATNILLKVSVASWAYRIRLPPLRDAGAATLSCANISVNVTLRPHADHLKIERCEVVVPEVSLRANEARLSWLYNSLAAVAKASIRKAVEAALQNVVRTALEEQLAQWSDHQTIILQN